MSKSVKSNQQIIREISAIVEPHMKFDIYDVYGVLEGISYPGLESLDLLHFKYVGKKTIISKNKENDLISQVKSLSIGEVQIHKYDSIGKFMVITLDKYHKRIIDKYNKYQLYRNSNAEKINNIYQYLGEKVPEEFVGWVLYKECN
jgi:hypothetical protein